jgi:hypothetical protein
MRTSTFVPLACSIALIAGMVALTPDTAMAHFDDSRTTIGTPERNLERGDRIVFFGRLNNEHRKCERREIIELVHRGEGVVDTDRTDREGEFVLRNGRFQWKQDKGWYFARFRGSGRFGYNDRHRCGHDRSRGIRLH